MLSKSKKNKTTKLVSAKLVASKPVYTKLDIFYKGKAVIQVSYKSGHYTRDEITAIANKLSTESKEAKQDFLFIASLKYPEHWRSGYLYSAGEQCKLYTQHDSDKEYFDEP